MRKALKTKNSTKVERYCHVNRAFQFFISYVLYSFPLLYKLVYVKLMITAMSNPHNYGSVSNHVLHNFCCDN